MFDHDPRDSGKTIIPDLAIAGGDRKRTARKGRCRWRSSDRSATACAAAFAAHLLVPHKRLPAALWPFDGLHGHRSAGDLSRPQPERVLRAADEQKRVFGLAGLLPAESVLPEIAERIAQQFDQRGRRLPALKRGQHDGMIVANDAIIGGQPPGAPIDPRQLSAQSGSKRKPLDLE
jgi:hypothetical protein